jgi:hypothetical protein
MKKLLYVSLAVFFTGCFLFQDDELLPAEEARIEIRAAGQEISSNLDRFAQTPSIETLLFLKKLLPTDEEWVLAMESTIESISMYTLASINDVPETNKNTSPTPASIYEFSQKKGVFQYNFNVESFDLLNSGVDYLQYIFPGNAEHLTNSRLNSALTINDLNIIVIPDTVESCKTNGSYITRAKGQIVIDNQTTLTIDHLSGYSEMGLILSGETEMNSAPYQLSFSQKIVGNLHKAVLSFKENGATILSYALDLMHASNGEAIEKASGSFSITPLLFEGEIHPEALCKCSTEDITCLNENLKVTIKHTGLKKTIGQLEYRMYLSPGLQTETAGLHIIYEDGSSELLSDFVQARIEGL